METARYFWNIAQSGAMRELLNQEPCASFSNALSCRSIRPSAARREFVGLGLQRLKQKFDKSDDIGLNRGVWCSTEELCNATRANSVMVGKVAL